MNIFRQFFTVDIELLFFNTVATIRIGFSKNNC